jgi:maltose O-acetyltransferase
VASVSRWPSLLAEEVHWVRPRLWAMNVLVRLLPDGAGQRLRPLVYRWFGIPIGRGTVVFGPLRFGWYGEVFRNLSIGRNCFFNRDVFIDTTARVVVGDNVTFGHEVAVITSNHDMAHAGYRAGVVRPGPVTIGNGVWIAARVTMLPGVTVHDGAVVAAGAVVTRDVPAHTLAGGVPARVLRSLPCKAMAVADSPRP